MRALGREAVAQSQLRKDINRGKMTRGRGGEGREARARSGGWGLPGKGKREQGVRHRCWGWLGKESETRSDVELGGSATRKM